MLYWSTVSFLGSFIRFDIHGVVTSKTHVFFSKTCFMRQNGTLIIKPNEEALKKIIGFWRVDPCTIVYNLPNL